MEHILNFYLTLMVTLLFIMAARSVYHSYKLHAYILKTHPEKAEIIGISPKGPFNGFKFYRYIFNRNSNETDEIANKLKRLAKNYIKYTIMIMVSIPFGAIFIFLMLG